NVVSLALGVGAAAWTVLRPKNAARNLVRLEFARIQLELTLFLYPAISLLGQFGDFEILRRSLNALADHAGDAVLAGWGAVAVLAIVLWRRRWRHRFALLTSPHLGVVAAARRRLAEEPGDLEARDRLGRALVALGDHRAARAELEAVIA